MSKIEERIEELSPKTRSYVYAVYNNGKERFLYSYPDNKSRIIRVLMGADGEEYFRKLDSHK